MSDIVKQEEKKNQIQASKEQQVLMPIAENYMKLFPEIVEDKTFNARQAVISMALKMSETKDKAGRKAIDVCTKESVLQVAQEVLVKRLDLMKNQAALIVRGDKLMLQAQYQGNVKRALELNPQLDHFNFVPIYKGDKVALGVDADGKYNVTSHETSFANISNTNLMGGYVRAIAKDGSVYMTEVMTMEQIKVAWSKSSNSSLSVHKQFPVKMVRKTILNSMCAWLINTTGEKEEYEEVSDEQIDNQGMAVEINEDQDYGELVEIKDEPIFEDVDSQPTEAELENDNMSQEEIDSILDEIEQDEPIEYPSEMVVSYADWKNNYAGKGVYEMVKDSYSQKEKTVKIRKIK